ncbi:hypothetical protein GCM10008018_60370 [Paenibacillus marchantiophytorum]|uniref:Uncharacterized protein n=1 Tax=Paenibacillus marchantiophytorum TaxID=1619310 RepID=A0ABQ1FCG5_9BACL|nr:hypothetical protein [Paenibacillus marchantiophytorum]GGA06433.1 hypothetical protein GCM10008018_60370 [Paenibacillus marchantiophytorum]
MLSRAEEVALISGLTRKLTENEEVTEVDLRSAGTVAEATGRTEHRVMYSEIKTRLREQAEGIVRAAPKQPAIEVVTVADVEIARLAAKKSGRIEDIVIYSRLKQLYAQKEDSAK